MRWYLSILTVLMISSCGKGLAGWLPDSESQEKKPGLIGPMMIVCRSIDAISDYDNAGYYMRIDGQLHGCTARSLNPGD